VHVANIAAVLHNLPPTVSQRVRMVFVTTDPERDTPRCCAGSSTSSTRASSASTGTPTRSWRRRPRRGSRRDEEVLGQHKPGEYLIGHAAFVFAYTPDGMGRFLYPFGIRQADWAHDIPRLVDWEKRGS